MQDPGLMGGAAPNPERRLYLRSSAGYDSSEMSVHKRHVQDADKGEFPEKCVIKAVFCRKNVYFSNF